MTSFSWAGVGTAAERAAAENNAATISVFMIFPLSSKAVFQRKLDFAHQCRGGCDLRKRGARQGCAGKPEIRPVRQIVGFEPELQLVALEGQGEGLRCGEVPGEALRTAHRIAADVAEG